MCAPANWRTRWKTPRSVFSAYYGLWAGHLNRSEPALLREMADLFLSEATARPDCPEALVGHRTSGFTWFYFGDFSSAHDHFQKAIELYDQARHGNFANRFGQSPRASAEIADALTLWVLGSVDEALPLAHRALAEAEFGSACSDDGLCCPMEGPAWPFATRPGSSRGGRPDLAEDRLGFLIRHPRDRR